MTSSGDRVYRTRVVGGPGWTDSCRNHFADPDEAKRYLEEACKARWDLELGDWRSEQSADEKWSVGIEHESFDRAVVMACKVYEDADEPLEALNEILDELNGEVESRA